MFRAIQRFFVDRAYQRLVREVLVVQRRLEWLERQYAEVGPRDDVVAEIARSRARLEALFEEQDYVRAKLISLS